MSQTLDITNVRPTQPNQEPFPLMPPGMPDDWNARGYGLCDPSFRGIKQAGESWRFTTAYLRLTAVAGGAMTYAAATVNAFNYGEDEALTQYGFTTAVGQQSDTDLNSQGAPVKEYEKFYAVGMGCEILRPFTSTGAQDKTYDEWLSAWRSRLYEIIAENTALQFQYGDEACEYVLGTVGMWPRIVGAQGGSTIRGGAGMGPANMVPFKRPVEMGARDNSDQLTINLINGNTITIGADPIVPIPVGVTSVIVPVQISLYGFPVCAPIGMVDARQTPAALLEAVRSNPGFADQLRALLAR